MSTDYKEVQQSALKLNENHRAELAKQLINSLDQHQQIDEDVEKAWIDEIKRRKAQIKSGSVTPISGHEVHKAARELLKK